MGEIKVDLREPEDNCVNCDEPMTEHTLEEAKECSFILGYGGEDRWGD